MSKAIIYARVSTDEQADNYSLPTQIAACEKYAEKSGMQVAATFKDDYTGTTPIEERPEGAKAYEMLSEGAADALIVLSMDRLVRPPEEGDEWAIALLIRGLSKLGKEIHTVKRGKIGVSFADILIAVLDAKSAGDWRRGLLEAMSRGKLGKAQHGDYVGGGKPPYGYQCAGEKKTVALEVNEAEAKIVRFIFQWYAQGDESGHPLTAYQIAKKLSLMRIDSPGATRLGKRKKTAKSCWPNTMVSAILKNEVYAGVWYFSRKKRVNHKLVRNHDRSQWIAIKVPAVVSRELWERAQEQIKENEHNTQRDLKYSYLMQGRLTCGVCGGAMAGSSVTKCRNGHAYLYYRCAKGKAGHGKNWDQCGCGAKGVRVDAVDAKVWSWVQHLFEEPETLVRGLRVKQSEQDKRAQVFRDRLDLLNRQIEGCKQQLGNQIALYSGMAVSEITRALFADQEKTLTGQITYMEGQKRKLEKQIAETVISDEAIVSLEQTAKKMRRGFPKANFNERRIVIERLDVRAVAVNEGRGKIRMEVSCILTVNPDKPDTLFCTPLGSYQRSDGQDAPDSHL